MHHDMIVRITKYDRTLRQLKNIGFERVFANNIGDAVGVSAALVRKDLSLLNIIGQKRGGYDIDRLIESLNQILGRGGTQHAAIAGCGRIGGALLRYSGFESDGIKIVAGFEINSRICEENTCPVPIYSWDDMPQVVKEQQIKLAIIAVPEQAAIDVFDKLVEAGVRGFLNFTTAGLKPPRHTSPEAVQPGEHIIVHNVNIGLELEQIVYELNIADRHII